MNWQFNKRSQFALSCALVVALFSGYGYSAPENVTESMSPEELGAIPEGLCLYNGGIGAQYSIEISNDETINALAPNTIIQDYTPYNTDVRSAGGMCKCFNVDPAYVAPYTVGQSNYFTSIVSLPSLTYNGRRYVKLSDYLAIGLTLDMVINAEETMPMDIFDIVNHNNGTELSASIATKCGPPYAYNAPHDVWETTGYWRMNNAENITSATSGKVDLLILQPFANSINFNGEVARIYATTNPNGYPAGSEPWAIININVDVESNLTCAFNLPNSTVDFGEINQSAFNINKGDVVSGSEKELPLDVDCNIPTNGMTLGVVGDPATNYPQAIKAYSADGSDSGIGVVVTDKDSNILPPNTPDKTEGEQLTSQKYKFNLKTYLTKTDDTLKVNPGSFRATATLQLAFE